MTIISTLCQLQNSARDAPPSFMWGMNGPTFFGAGAQRPKSIDTYRGSWYTCGMKKQTSIRLSSEAQELLLKLVQKLGISQSDVLELAIRRLAEQEKLR